MRILLLLLVFFTFSCTKKLVKYSSPDDCKTVMAGEFHNLYSYPGKGSCLFMNTGSKNKKIYGQIIELKDNGLLFDQKDEGLFRPGIKFLDFRDVRCVINDSGEVIYGLPPGNVCTILRMNITLKKIDVSDEQLVQFQIDSNEPFSFCIQPGKYKIHKFVFYNKNISIEHFENLPTMEFEIEKDKINDLGRILIDIIQFPENDSHLINATKIELPPNVIFLGAPLLFNIISTTAQVLFKDYYVQGIHTIKFKKLNREEKFLGMDYQNNNVFIEPSQFEIKILDKINKASSSTRASND